MDIQSNPDIQKLPLRYKQSDFEFEQVCRTDKVALYRGSKPGCNSVSWEVIKIKVLKASAIKFGDTMHYYPDREYLPKSEDFGKLAWCYGNEAAATARYHDVNNGLYDHNTEPQEY